MHDNINTKTNSNFLLFFLLNWKCVSRVLGTKVQTLFHFPKRVFINSSYLDIVVQRASATRA